jgi:hypothetical protein
MIWAKIEIMQWFDKLKQWYNELTPWFDKLTQLFDKLTQWFAGDLQSLPYREVGGQKH